MIKVSKYLYPRSLDPLQFTVCPRSSALFYVVTYYMKWVTTFWTHSTAATKCLLLFFSEESGSSFTQAITMSGYPGPPHPFGGGAGSEMTHFLGAH